MSHLNRLTFAGVLTAAFAGLFLAGCPNKTQPASPQTAMPTATPSYNSRSVSFATALTDPVGIRYDGHGKLWVVDDQNYSLTEWTTAGGTATAAQSITSFNSGSAVTVFNQPWGVGIDPSTGNVYVADGANSQVEVFTSGGAYLTAFGTGQLGANWAEGIAVNSAGTTAYLLDYDDSTIYAYSIGGSAGSPVYNYQFSFGNTGSPHLDFPSNLALDKANNVYVASYNNNLVIKYSPTGAYQMAITLVTPSFVSGAAIGTPTDVAVDGSGNIFVSDDTNSVIQEFDTSGSPLGQWGYSYLGAPESLTLDPLENIYVANEDNSGVNDIVMLKAQ